MTALSTQLHTQPHADAHINSKLQRLAAAKAALAAAESKQGLRAVDAVHTTEPVIAYETKGTRPKNPFSVITTPKTANPTTTLRRTDRDPIPVHETLATLLPHGLTPGGITTTQGSTHTALALITQHTANGGWAAIIGAPNINYTTLQDLGADLTHIIAVPHPNENTPQVIAALIEGVDLLLLGPNTTLTHAEQRTITARNRERGTHIISQKPWTGARTHLTTTHGTWHGTNKGLGRLTNTTYTLAKTDPNGHHTTTLTTHNGQLKTPPTRATPTALTPTMASQTKATHTTTQERTA